jgi:hypothetical protein
MEAVATRTIGPGERSVSVVDHISKELHEHLKD